MDSAVNFGMRGRYSVSLWKYAYDFGDVELIPRKKRQELRLVKRRLRQRRTGVKPRKPWIHYRARCLKCGNHIIVASQQNLKVRSPIIKLMQLDKCTCGCWVCGKAINRGNPVIGSHRGIGQHRTNTRFCSNACRQKAYRRRAKDAG